MRSRRWSRFTQVDSDCEPLLHNGGVASNDSEEETQVVSVHLAPAHSVTEGRVAIPVRQISSRVSKRLRLTGHHHGTMPTDDTCEALEFDLTQGDSSGFDAPPPLHTPVLPPPSVLHTQLDSDVDVQATALDRPSSPPLCLFQDLQYDPAMGVEVGGTVPESDSSSTMSLAADGGSVAGSAGFGVDVQCIAARAHGTRHGKSERGNFSCLIPRMLLHRPPRGGLVPRKRLEERFRSCEAGEWE